jgi:hypothetical protein
MLPSLPLGKPCLGLDLQNKGRILKLRIVNALVFFPELRGWNGPHNDFTILNE